MKGLGYLFDIQPAFTPVDFNTSDAATGFRVHMRNYENIALILYKGVGTAGADPVVTVQEHDAATAGNSGTLAVFDEFWKKEETALDGDELWVRTAVSPIAGVINAGLTSAEQEGMYVFEASASQLSAGYQWISFNIAATVANAQLVSGFYVMTGLKIQRDPNLLAQPNA